MGKLSNRLRPILINSVVLVASFAVGLLLCEAGARMFLNPADYLSVTLVRDDILGAKIAPGSSGFDEWGFRNASVPATATIVAVGDSHTYGNNASREESWPYVAGRLSGNSVYNLGLGGYGPNQYYHLLTTQALKLKPQWIFCGLYFGDDFENAFRITYGKDYWSSLRKEEWSRAGAQADIWEKPEEARGLAAVRNWFSKNSVVYRLVFHGPFAGILKTAMQTRSANRDQDQVATLQVPEANIREAFRPIEIRKRLDQNIPQVREGMRITFDLLQRMDRAARANGSRFVVVLIPTKESVFSDYLLGSSQIQLKQVIAELTHDEGEARKQLVAFLEGAGISYVDSLPALRRGVSGQLYTPGDRDMHPAKNGYRVIGEAVAEFLKNQKVQGEAVQGARPTAQ